MDSLKGVRRYKGFKLTGACFPQILSNT